MEDETWCLQCQPGVHTGAGPAVTMIAIIRRLLDLLKSALHRPRFKLQSVNESIKEHECVHAGANACAVSCQQNDARAREGLKPQLPGAMISSNVGQTKGPKAQNLNP